MIDNLKKKFKERDRAISILSKSGTLRVVAVRNTNTVLTAQAVHELPGFAAFFLAKTITATTMMSVFLKGEERVIADIRSDGMLANIYAEVLHVGECRGFVQLNEDIIAAASVNSPPPMLGAGTLQVSRILYNQVEPIVGIIPLQADNASISAHFNNYFAQSEQINTSVILDTIFQNDKVTSSAGLMVQAMPGATNEEIEAVNVAIESISKMNSLCNKIRAQDSLEEFLKHILPFEFDVLKTKQIDFFCRCNIDKYKANLLMLSINELQSMKETGQNELVCQFCNKKYYLSDTDFDDMIYQKMAATN